MTQPFSAKQNTRLRALALLPLAALALSACTPASRVRSVQALAPMQSVDIACVLVATPTTQGLVKPIFKVELDQRRFDAELRVARIYLAERLAAGLKTMDKPLAVKRTGSCVDGLVLKSNIGEFNPGGKFTGAVTMAFGAQLRIEKSDGTKLADYTLQHGKGMNAAATVVSMASPLPVMSGVGDVPTLISTLVDKVMDQIKDAIDSKKNLAKK
jgi:hypothetical protein